MKISLNWLSDHLETTASIDDIVATLNRLGLVVDGKKNPGQGLEDFIIAEIIDAKPHPSADRLQVCTVDTGTQLIQVVCGAANARAGLKTVLAQPGVVIPNNSMVIKRSTIREVESQGMLCSYAELRLNIDSSKSHEGIIELSDSAPVGKSYVTYAGLDDYVLDVDVTPNRGDCFAVHGIARDLAAAGIGLLKAQVKTKVEGTFACPVKITFDLPTNSENACTHFTGRIIRGVKNGPSPEWLQQKLQAVGMKSISALVDITNYMAMDWARPLHVFDAVKIGDHLTVRLSHNGEKLWGLDDKEYALDNSITVIADDLKPLAIAGIMGGRDSGCTDETTTVFLESAYFDRVRTALSGQKLGIHSEARARFERGVDPELVIAGLDRATQLILDLCGGEASTMIDVRPKDYQQQSCPEIILTTDFLLKHSGLSLSIVEIETILRGLGISSTVMDDGCTLYLHVPTWRHDIESSYDIVEEILRIKGYDCIPATTLPHTVINHHFESIPGSVLRQQREWIARRVMAARGLSEALTWSFTRQDHAQLFNGGQEALILENPISQDLSTMRPSLLPNLISAVGRNLDRGQNAPAFFEVGSQFSDDSSGGQQTVVAGVRSGRNITRHWQAQKSPLSLYTVKADCIAFMEACGVDVSSLQTQTKTPQWYHPGRSGALQLGSKNTIAVFGELHPSFLKKMDVPGPMFALEIYLNTIPKPRVKLPLVTSSYQSVERDLAFIVDTVVTAEKIMSVIKKVDKHLIKKVSLFDVYQAKELGTMQRSLAFCIRLEPQQQTLTDQHIQELMTRIIDAVKRETGGELRS